MEDDMEEICDNEEPVFDPLEMELQYLSREFEILWDMIEKQ